MDRFPEWLNATLASDAAEGRGVLADWIRVLAPNSRVVGPAMVVQASRDDNLAFVEAVGAPPPRGCVVVVSGHNTSRTSTLGDLYALELQIRGVVGLVTDGLVRDAREIREMGFPVWCRGVTPTASTKRGPGSVGGSVVVGGAVVRDGDIVIADDDGVVVWPRDEVETLLERARAKLESDSARLQRLHELRAQLAGGR